LSEIHVEFIGRFRELFKSKSINVPVNASISLLKLIKELGEKAGVDLVSHFLSPHGESMDDYSLIILNGNPVDLTRLDEYSVGPGDRVVLSPSVAGGG
jgi:molybdopterin converting factor small subunit